MNMTPAFPVSTFWTLALYLKHTAKETLQEYKWTVNKFKNIFTEEQEHSNISGLNTFSTNISVQVMVCFSFFFWYFNKWS